MPKFSIKYEVGIRMLLDMQVFKKNLLSAICGLPVGYPAHHLGFPRTDEFVHIGDLCKNQGSPGQTLMSWLPSL